MCMQSIGFPTYCRVVTITEKVRRMTELMPQCSRNTEESMCTWLTLIRDLRRRKMSSILAVYVVGVGVGVGDQQDCF